MDLSKLRRILIAIVGLLLFINLGLLVYAKVGSAPTKVVVRRYDVTAWSLKPAATAAATKELEAAGRKVTVSDTRRVVPIPNGYRVVMKADETMLKAVKETLTYKKHTGLKIVADGTELQYGGVFMDKAKAEATASRVKKAERITFQVVQNYRQVEKPAQKLVLKDLEEPAAREVESMLQGKGMEVELKELPPATPAAPK